MVGKMKLCFEKSLYNVKWRSSTKLILFWCKSTVVLQKSLELYGWEDRIKIHYDNLNL